MVGRLLSFWNGLFFRCYVCFREGIYLNCVVFSFDARQLPFFYATKKCVFSFKKKVELKKLEAENAARFGPGNPFLEGMTGPFGQ